MRHKKTILLVEDEVLIAMSEKRSLEKYGYAVITVHSGENAIEAVENIPDIDLILMDINLGGGIDGTEAAEHILKSRDLPVVFLSSHIEPEIVERTEKITSYGYVVKNTGITVLDASMKMAFKLFDANMKWRQIEGALRASEVQYRRLFESAKDGILLLDVKTGMIVDVNPFLVNLLGYTYEQFLGKTIWDIGFLKDIIGNQEKFNELVKNEYVRYEHLPLETVSQHIVHVEFISNVYEVDDKHVIQCNIREITERKKAEDALREAIAAKDTFFNIIAHDLTNPTIVFQSGLEMLHAHLRDSGDQEALDISTELHKTSDHLSALLDHLLTWARLQSGRFPYHPAHTDLCYTASYAVNQTLQAAHQKQMSVISTIQEGMEVYADEDMVQVVLRNLITNAIKFTPEGGNISVDAREHGDSVEVSVSDNGVGMSDEKRQRVFRVGEKRISSPGTSNEKGTGLGLIVCREFVETHGGRIWVESEEGKGSTVRFTLPKAEH